MLAPRTVLAERARSLDLYRVNYKGKEGFWCIGINAVGFDLKPWQGRFGDYSIPSQAAIQYFHDQGANCFRLPISWERMQSDPMTEDWDPVPGIVETVNFITRTLGDYCIIDPHNNFQGLSYGGESVDRGMFLNLWGAIAGAFGSNERVVFGLYNEPRGGRVGMNTNFFDTEQSDAYGVLIREFAEWMQAAIHKIRSKNARNIIVVPGMKFSTLRDFSGAARWGEYSDENEDAGNRWGEELDGNKDAGNTRLASLMDPLDLIVYDVHQFLNDGFDGLTSGCAGYDRNIYHDPYPSALGADWGLDLAIAWARRYNKKFIMTEIAAYPDGVTDVECQRKVSNFLQKMHDSGVFIGFTVWQFGCPCLGDQYALRPYNLHWYRWADWKAVNFTGHRSVKCSDPEYIVSTIRGAPSRKKCKRLCRDDARCSGFTRKKGDYCLLFTHYCSPRQCEPASYDYQTFFYC